MRTTGSVEDTGPLPGTSAASLSTTFGAESGGSAEAPEDDGAPDDAPDTDGAPDTDDDSDSGSGFFGGNDLAPMGCDVFAQDCPAGEKCAAYGDDGGTWNSVRCVPIAAQPNQPGDACVVQGEFASGLDDCDLGSMCFQLDERNQGTCVALCTGTPMDPSCGVGMTCSVSNGGALNLCLTQCNPALDECPAGQGCLPIDSDFVCVAVGATAGYGESCGRSTCGPGLFCSTQPHCPVGEDCCSAYCDTTDPEPNPACPDAAMGQMCEPVFQAGEAPEGLENLGACLTP